MAGQPTAEFPGRKQENDNLLRFAEQLFNENFLDSIVGLYNGIGNFETSTWPY